MFASFLMCLGELVITFMLAFDQAPPVLCSMIMRGVKCLMYKYEGHPIKNETFFIENMCVHLVKIHHNDIMTS